VETAIENAVDKLAIMINEGFKTTATKDDINNVEVRLDSIEVRLGKIENLLMEEQRRKIENLEARMKTLEDALAV
jgi:polyhydroxyalkanoate synthesis regulator phasin